MFSIARETNVKSCIFFLEVVFPSTKAHFDLNLKEIMFVCLSFLFLV